MKSDLEQNYFSRTASGLYTTGQDSKTLMNRMA